MPRKPTPKADEKDIRQVEVMAGMGMSLEQISLVIGISRKTLTRWLNTPDVKEAFDRGRAQGALALTKAAYQQAIGGNTTMLMFYLRSQLGWRDTPAPEAPVDSGTKIIIQLPDNGRQVRGPQKG